MIIVKPRILKVKFSNRTSTYYASLTKMVEAIKSYTLEGLEKIVDMKLIWTKEPHVRMLPMQFSPEPILEDW